MGGGELYICSPRQLALDYNPSARLPTYLLHTRSFGKVGMVLVEIFGLRPLRPNGEHDSSSISMELSWDTKISDIFLSSFEGWNLGPLAVASQQAALMQPPQASKNRSTSSLPLLTALFAGLINIPVSKTNGS